MINQQTNDHMTRVGLGAPAGDLLRRYWQPVALVEEIEGIRPVKAVEVLGQHFVLFRDQAGALGLLDRDCPHRGADLAFGRVEDGGLRCAFHGWLFDKSGNCLQTPAEPAGSRLCDRVQQRAYPVAERSGVVFAYLGSGEPPAFPSFDCFVAPDTHTFAFKGHLQCNWLQALEVGIDPAHASYLHRFFQDEAVDASYGKQFRGASADSVMPITKVLREYDRPEIVVERVEHGLRLTALRDLAEGTRHVRVTNVVFPQAFVIPMSSEMTISQWHVPVSDTECYWYAIFTSFTTPVDKATMRKQRLALYELPDYKPRLNRANNWGFDPREQIEQTYTGMGHDINVHDQWAVESQGRIQDRTREHLGTTDKGIIQYRRMLLEAIEGCQAGRPLPMHMDPAQALAMTGPASIDGIAVNLDPGTYWRQADQARRQSSHWARSVP